MTSTATTLIGQGRVSDAVIDAVSGMVGSVISLLATYPLKTIYTLQALNNSSDPGASSLFSMIRRYKLAGLYTGIEPNIVESALSSSVYFYLYNRLRDQAVARRADTSNYPVQGSPALGGSSKDQDIGFWASLLVPAIAGIGNQLVTMPASVIATRMQAMKKAHMDGVRTEKPSVSAIIKDIMSESGISGFWAGLLPSLILISNPAIQYMLYEQLLRALKAWKRRRLEKQQQLAEQATGTASKTQDGSLQAQPLPLPLPEPAATATADGLDARASSPGAAPSLDQPGAEEAVQHVPAAAQPPPVIRCSAGETFLASALSKVGATLATYWLVVVKSRIQAAGKSTPAGQQYAGTLDTLVRIWREEGPGGFVKGLRAKILQTALSAALMLMLKEQVYQWTRAVLTNPHLKPRPQQLVS